MKSAPESVALERAELSLGTEYVAPRNPTEQALVEIWAQVLNLDCVGVDDDFFELGGDSVSGALMIAEIDVRLGIRIPISLLLEFSTAAALAAEIAQRGQTGDAAGIYRVAEGGTMPPLFLVHGAAGIISLPDQFYQALGRDVPVYGLQARGLLGLSPPHDTFEAMAAEYVPLIRSVQPRGPHLIAGICIGGTVALEMAHQLLAAGDPPRALLAVDPYAIDAEVGGGATDPAVLRQTHAGRVYLERIEGRLRGIRGLHEGETEDNARRDAVLKAMIAVQDGINRAADRYVMRPYPRMMSLFCNARTAASILHPQSHWRAAAQGRARLWNLAANHVELMSDKIAELGRAMRRDIDRALAGEAAPGPAGSARDGG